MKHLKLVSETVPPYPWAGVIHLVNAAIRLATVMHVIQLVIEAVAAKARSSIVITDEDILLPQRMGCANIVMDGPSTSA